MRVMNALARVGIVLLIVLVALTAWYAGSLILGL